VAMELNVCAFVHRYTWF